MRGLTVTLTVIYRGLVHLVERCIWDAEAVSSSLTSSSLLKQQPPRGRRRVTLIVVN